MVVALACRWTVRQAYFIYIDEEMYEPKADEHCIPNTWTLSDDLGTAGPPLLARRRACVHLCARTLTRWVRVGGLAVACLILRGPPRPPPSPSLQMAAPACVQGKSNTYSRTRRARSRPT